jgi:hypothetical protein
VDQGSRVPEALPVDDLPQRRVEDIADRQTARHDAWIRRPVRRDAQLAGPAMAAEAGERALGLFTSDTAPVGAHPVHANAGDAEIAEEADCPRDMRVVLIDDHDARAHRRTSCHQAADVGDGSCMAVLPACDRIVPGRLVRIDGRGEAHRPIARQIGQAFVQPGQVRIHLREDIAASPRVAREAFKIGVELRLAADELHMPAAEIERLVDQALIVFPAQAVVLAAMGTGLGVAVDAFKIAAARQFQPQEVEPGRGRGGMTFRESLS